MFFKNKMFIDLFFKIVLILTVSNINDSKAATTKHKQHSDNKSLVLKTSPTEITKKTEILFSKENNQKIKLTIVSEEDAKDAFSELAARADLPFEYQLDGCYARAHKMVRLLENRDIIAGKAFIEGKLYVDTKDYGEVGWKYQVAPVIMVRKGSKIVPYILDPSLFSKAVPYVEWKAKIMSKSKSKIEKEYYTNRFAYDFNDRLVDYSDYTEESLDDMDATNRNISRMLYENKKQKQK